MEPSKIKMFKITNFFWRVYITGHVGSWFSPTRDQTHTLLQWKHGVLTTGLPGSPYDNHLKVLLFFIKNVHQKRIITLKNKNAYLQGYQMGVFKT